MLVFGVTPKIAIISLDVAIGIAIFYAATIVTILNQITATLVGL